MSTITLYGPGAGRLLQPGHAAVDVEPADLAVEVDEGGQVDGAEDIEEKDEKYGDQDDLEEDEVKVVHHPAGATVVPVPHLRHKVLKSHGFYHPWADAG